MGNELLINDNSKGKWHDNILMYEVIHREPVRTITMACEKHCGYHISTSDMKHSTVSAPVRKRVIL